MIAKNLTMLSQNETRLLGHEKLQGLLASGCACAHHEGDKRPQHTHMTVSNGLCLLCVCWQCTHTGLHTL